MQLTKLLFSNMLPAFKVSNFLNKKIYIAIVRRENPDLNCYKTTNSVMHLFNCKGSASLIIHCSDNRPCKTPLLTYIKSGLKQCIMAQNAKPSLKDVVRLVICTPS